MPLDPPNLDDRTFQDIVDETKRLIPRFTPEWTNHNVSDPGVALIELFAWVSEMVLYRVNQVPERMYVEFLNLVGIEPFPPSVAHTDLTFWLSAPAERIVRVPTGTEVSTALGDADAIVFSTSDEGVVGSPEARRGLHLRRGPRRDERRLGGPDAPGPVGHVLPVRPAGRGRRALPGHAGVARRLRRAPRPRGPGRGHRRRPAERADRLGGLERRGVDQDDRRVRRHRRPEQARLGRAPRAREARAARCSAGRSRTGCASGCCARSPASPPTRRRRGSRRSRCTPSASRCPPSTPAPSPPRCSAGRPGSPGRPSRCPWRPWPSGAARSTWSSSTVAARRCGPRSRTSPRSGENDLHVVWDSNTGEVRFGPTIRYPDGERRQHGAIPRDGAEIRVSGYRTGGGDAGNVGARTLTALRTALPFIASVTNLLPARGGVDAETAAEAKVRGPLTLRTGQRAVTASDFEAIARQASIEVARARCLPASQTGSSVVRVLVVPKLRDRPAHAQARRLRARRPSCSTP